jgi:hypothetical protein
MKRFQTLLSIYTCAATARCRTRWYVVGRCRLKHIETSVETAWFDFLKLLHDVPLSKIAFKFKSRRYTVASTIIGATSMAGRCRLKRVERLSKPMQKATGLCA